MIELNELLGVLGLVLIVKGLPTLLSPGWVHRLIELVLQWPPRRIRAIGLLFFVLGGSLLFAGGVVAALGLLLMLGALVLLVSPETWKRIAGPMARWEPRRLRLLGLVAVIVGVGLGVVVWYP